MAESEHRVAICTEAGRLEEDVEHSAKGHYNAAERWSTMHLALGIPATVLAAVGAGSSALGSSDVLKAITVVAGILASVLAGLMTFIDAANRASQHRQAGDQHLDLRARLRQLHQVKAKDLALTDEALSQLLEQYQGEKTKLTSESPQIPGKDYRKARKGIRAGEASHRVDAPARKAKRSEQ